ncbi:MAG: YtxH domain-containing protein [Desulfuromonadales bacterium]|nr:YtxH domain-containing protein [Desulfuromonadales bacterium]
MSEEQGIPVGTVVVSFMAGAAIGTGLALLFAPKRGCEVRESIAEYTENTIDKIKEYTREAQEKIKTTINDGKEIISEKKAILTSAIEAGREAIQKEKELLTKL